MYDYMRNKYKKLLSDYPDIVDAISNKDNCWREIMKVAEKHRDTLIDIVLQDNNPEILFYWALHIGDRPIMKKALKDTKHALYIYMWIRHIGDIQELRDVLIDINEDYYVDAIDNWLEMTDEVCV